MTDRLPNEDSWRERARHLTREAMQMVELRRQLAELEVRHGIQCLRRVSILVGVGAVLALVGLPVFVICLAYGLEQWTRLTFIPAALLLGSLLVIPGVLLIGFALRGFRRGFHGLQHSLAELREDLIWLKEWAGQQDDEAESAP